jgi:hypothetical protein
MRTLLTFAGRTFIPSNPRVRTKISKTDSICASGERRAAESQRTPSLAAAATTPTAITIVIATRRVW